MTLVALALVAYLIGSIPFAVIVSRLFGLPDPRSYGSGNPGATNVLRTGRKAAAALTLAGDAAKGWLAVFGARHLFPDNADAAIAVAAVAVTLGRVYSVSYG
jgi:glycerol-3-phosphate acyltransferase PlsY